MATTTTDDYSKVLELIKDMPIAMLTTRGTDGKLRSRPMAVSDTGADGTLYFLTGEDSGKAHDLEADREVIVTFAHPGKSSYLAVRGSAVVTQDRATIKHHWSEQARGWFPKGIDDPNLALISVDIEEAEYWDTPSGRIVVAFAYVKAMLTGKPPTDIGEHGKIKM